MSKYKVVYNRKGCIGAGECEALSKLWKVKNDGKADLSGATINPKTGNFELEIADSDAKVQESVARSCPAGCIKLEKIN
jgi:ferredoxin